MVSISSAIQVFHQEWRQQRGEGDDHAGVDFVVENAAGTAKFGKDQSHLAPGYHGDANDDAFAQRFSRRRTCR